MTAARREWLVLAGPSAFALAVSAQAAGIRAIFLIGTASARLKCEPFAALYAFVQNQIPNNRQGEPGPIAIMIRCGGMLPSITKAAHPITAAVTVIVIAGQWCGKKARTGMQTHGFQIELANSFSMRATA